MLVSHFFVAITLIEFAVILLIKQNFEKSKVTSNFPCGRLQIVDYANDMNTNKIGQLPGNLSKESRMRQQATGHSMAIDISTKIDKISCILFLCSYLVFILFYVLTYMHMK